MESIILVNSKKVIGKKLVRVASKSFVKVGVVLLIFLGDKIS